MLTLFLSAIALPAAAQTRVWTVDDSGGSGVDFTRLQDAIDAAADGDILIVRDGKYDPPPMFPPAPTRLAGKGLTLHADAGARPRIGWLQIDDLPAGSVATLRGLDFDTGLALNDDAGVVRLEDCALKPLPFSTFVVPLTVRDCAAVQLNGCTLLAGSQIILEPAGLDAARSSLSLYDCTLRGADGYGTVSTGGDGMTLVDGFLFASNTSFTGGNHGCAGDGLQLAGSAPVARTLGCTFAPGVPSDCGGSTGQGVLVSAGDYAALAGKPRSFTASSPVALGASTTLSFGGLSGDLVVGLYATDPAQLYLASLRGVLEVPTSGFGLSLLGSVPASGLLTLDVPILSLNGAGDVLYLQAAAFVPQQGFTLSGGTTLVLLQP